MAPTSNKLTSPTFKEEVIEAIGRLDRRGWTQHEIARALPKEVGVKLSQPQVGLYLKKIRERYREAIVGDRKELVEQQVAALTDVAKEAWAAWERGKEDARKVKRVKALRTQPVKISSGKKDAKGKTKFILISEEEMVEGRIPANAFLQTVLECWREIGKLRGLYPEEKVQQNNFILPAPDFWEQLRDGPVPTSAEEIEARIDAPVVVPQIPYDGKGESANGEHRNGEQP